MTRIVDDKHLVVLPYTASNDDDDNDNNDNDDDNSPQ